MCEHLRMDPKDDPEARIRELERPLADAARSSELGTGHSAVPPPTQRWTQGNTFPPPPPGPPAPWPGYEPYPAPPAPQRKTGNLPVFFMVGMATTMAVVGSIASFVIFSSDDSASTDRFTDSQSTTMRRTVVSPMPRPGAVAPTQVPTGETVTVSGINGHRTLECRDNIVIVSGVENELEITGHCTALTVSGVENVVTVESVDTIGVSGFDNRVTFHTGEPDVSKSGQSNVVEQG
jgi:hypothetical protein